VSGDPLHELAALQRRLQSYVDGCRRLPGDLPSLADGLQQNADRLAAIGVLMAVEPPTKAVAP
jgi:hypothetical protein